MKHLFGLAALTVLELSAAEQVTAAAAAGYDFVGLRLIPVAGQALPSFEPRDLERRVADTGMRVLDVEVFRLDPQCKVRDFEPAMTLAASVRATQILAHGADPEPARLAQNFGALCDLAARHGLAVNLEPMPWVEISNVAQARRLLDATGRDNAALLVDPIHFFRAENRFEDLEGAKLNYLQFCDAVAERPADTAELIRQARSDRRLPGEGGLDLRGLLRALPAGLPMALEIPQAGVPDPRQRARRTLEATRRFLAQAGE